MTTEILLSIAGQRIETHTKRPLNRNLLFHFKNAGDHTPTFIVHGTRSCDSPGYHVVGDNGGGGMRQERALKVVLVVVGLIFCGLVYPLMIFVKQEPALAMMLSVYVTLGIFLLLASRNPSANRTLIAFTAWSSFAHAALMAVQAFLNLIARGELIGSAVLVVIGVALIALAPAKQTMERVSAAVGSGSV
jgi:hypothetical protein